MTSAAATLTPDEAWPDMVFFIHPDGSIIFWSIRMLDVYPRRLPRVQLASWTVPGLIPPAIASKLESDVVVYPSSMVADWWYGRTAAESENGKAKHRSFRYAIQRPLPLTLVIRHAGSMSEWNATFIEKTSLSAVQRVEAVAWCSGHCRPVVSTLAHPVLRLALSVGQDKSGTEALLWSTGTSLGFPMREEDTLSECGKHVTLDAPASRAVAAWIPSYGAVVALLSTGSGISVLGGGVADTTSDHPSPELVEIMVLPDSSGQYIGLYVQPADCGHDAESYWVFAIAKGDFGEPAALSAWRITISGSPGQSGIDRFAARGTPTPTPSPLLLRKETDPPPFHPSTPQTGRKGSPPPLALKAETPTPILDLPSGDNSSAGHRAAVGPQFLAHPTVIARSVLQWHELEIEESAIIDKRKPPQPLHAGLITGVPDGCNGPFMYKTDGILTCGYSDGVVRVWLCDFEPASADALADTVKMHLAGDVKIARAASMDETLTVQFGNQAFPTHLATTYDGMMAVVLCSASDDATHGSVVALYNVAKTGEKLGFCSLIESEKDIQSLAWGTGAGGLCMLFIGVNGEVQTYAQQTNLRNAEANAFVQIAQTPIPREGGNQLPTGPDTMCVLLSGDLVISRNTELFSFGMWLDDAQLPISADSPATEGAGMWTTLTTLTSKVEEANEMLPVYHAEQLSALLLSGRKNRVKKIIQDLSEHVDAYYTETDDGEERSATKTVFTMSLFDIISADNDAAAKKSTTGTKKGSDEYDDLFSTSVGEGGPGSGETGFAASAKKLCERGQHIHLDRLNRKDQALSLAVIQSVADAEASEEALDDCAMRYFVPVNMNAYLAAILPPAQRPTGLPTYYYAWALLSETQEQLLEFSPAIAKNPTGPAGFQWEDLRALGAGYWVRNPAVLRKYIEKVAKNAFSKNNDPLTAAVWYLAMKKKTVLQALFRSVGDSRMSGFFSNNFTEERWQSAALKNAYALLGKQRYTEAVGFFLLGDELNDAVSTCIRQLKDLQMAVVICRLYEGDDSPTFKRLLQTELIDKRTEGPFMASIAQWLSKDYAAALDVLLASTVASSSGTEAKAGVAAAVSMEAGSEAAALNLSRHLREHILLRGSVAGVSTAAPIPRGMYVTAYHFYANRGMMLLALDTLVDMQRETEEPRSDAADGEVAVAKTAPSQPADPFAFNMGAFGAPADEPEEEPKKKKKKEKKPKPAADPFAFNMGAFGGGDFDSSSEEEESDEDDDETSGACSKSGTNKTIVRTWQLMSSVCMIAKYLLFWRSKRLSWHAFPEQLKTEVASMLEFCRQGATDDYSAKKGLMGAAGGPSSAVGRLDYKMVQKMLLRTTWLNEAPEIQCALLLDVDSSRLLPFMRNMCVELCSFIAAFAVPGLRAGVDLPPEATKDRIWSLATALSNCLRMMAAFRLPSQCRPTAFDLCEYIGAIYGALYIVAWLERDLDLVLKLLTNKPEAGLWGTLCPGADNAVAVVHAMALYARKDPFASRRQKVHHVTSLPPSIMDYIEAPVDADDEYRRVDEACPLDDMGNRGGEVPMAWTPEAAAKAYRWALLELVSAQRFVEGLRVLSVGAGIDMTDQTDGSVLFTEIMASLEHKTATLQCDLDALKVPTDLQETNAPFQPIRGGSMTNIHVVRGLFKVRSLMEIENNNFTTVSSRRLWHFVLRRDRTQPTVEYYMFGRKGEDDSFRKPTKRKLVTTAFHSSHAEMRSICLNSCNHDSMVVGTTKGLSELWLNRRDLEVDDFDDDSEFGSGIAVEGLNGSHSHTSGSSGLVESGSFSPPPSFSRSRSSSPGLGSSHPTSPGPDRYATKERFADDLDTDLVGLQRSLSSPCRVLASHPSMPCYLSGSADGSVKLWHFDQDHELWSFSHGSNAKVNSIRFEPYGNKLGVVNTLGELQLWRFLSGGATSRPYITIQVHSKRTDDFQFLGSSTVLASGGLSADGNNVAIWDTLTQRASQHMTKPVRSFQVCNTDGVRALSYINSTETLICGGGKGELAVLDIRQGAVVKSWDAHDDAINKLLVDVEHDSLISGSANGMVKVWSLSTLRETARFEGLHTKSSFFRSGVIDMALDRGDLYTAGADGMVKKIHLWDVNG
jgi:hypothetical protein